MNSIDDSAKGDLTQFWELITMIPCSLSDFNRQQDCYLQIFRSRIKNESPLKVEEATS